MTKAKKRYALLRQWKMLQLLEPRLPKAASLLRDELEEEGFSVDLRTVQRDLKELMEVFPISALPGKPISWRWDRIAKAFNIPGMDRTAALTFKMVNEFMAHLLPKSCLESLIPNLRLADEILDMAGNYCYWPDKVRVVPRTQPLLPPEVDGEILDAIYKALFQDQRFTATYLKKGAADPVEYVVNPLGLIVADPVLYLVATLWDYQDIKLLAVHRFQSVEIHYEPVTKPESFSLDSYLKKGALGFPVTEENTINLKVLFDRSAAVHLYESPLSQGQIMTDQADGRILVEAAVLDTQQLRWWLLSFGEHVEVVAPEALRREFSAIVQNMAKRYRD